MLRTFYMSLIMILGLSIQNISAADPDQGFNIDGTVTEDAGNLTVFIPLEGVKVYLQQMAEYVVLEKSDSSSDKGNKQSIIAPIEQIYITLDSCLTDKDGYYLFENVVPLDQGDVEPIRYTINNKLRLMFTYKGYQTKNVSFSLQNDTTINVALLPVVKADICGMVSEDTSPYEILKILKGVKIYLQKQENIIIYLDSLPVLKIQNQQISDQLLYYTVDSTESDEDGKYCFDKVEGDNYRLMFVKDGYQTKYTSFELTEDITINAALLPEGASTTITGSVLKITDKEGEVPAEGCTVTVEFPLTVIIMKEGIGKKSASTVEYTSVTDENGEYIITEIPVTYDNQPVTVTASLEGYSPVSKSVSLYNNFTATIDFMLEDASFIIYPDLITSLDNKNSVIHFASGTIQLNLNKSQEISISAFTLNGRKIDFLSQSRILPAGEHVIKLDLSRVSDNIILFYVNGDNFTRTKTIYNSGKQTE